MKKIYFLLLASFLGFNNLTAQTSVDILYAEDSLGGVPYCSGSFLPIEFMIYSLTSGYTPADAPTITVDFGDGTNTTFVDPNFASTFPESYAYVTHNYLLPGSYDITYMITMPDLMADTVIVYGDVVVSPCDVISGYVYNDDNTNCILDGLDVPLATYVVAKDPITGYFISYGITDVTGYYEILVPSGVAVDIEMWSGMSLTYVCPVSGTISTTAPSSGNDFAIDCASHDLQPHQWNGFMHPGFTECIKMGLVNWSCDLGTDVQLRVVVSDPLVTFVSGISAGGDITPTISGDTLTWDIPAAYISNYLMYYGYAPQLEMWMTTDVAAPLGSVICFDVIAEPLAGDLNTANNFQTLCYCVLNAYDPNYIEVLPSGTTAAGLIDPNLEMIYTINFQNTGNFPATNISIKDTLDLSVLDLSSFEYLSSTHAVTNIISSGNGAMVFQFDNINLPDSTADEPNSHGSITYRIKQQPNLAPSTTIENTAYIYFDFNAPIITNTALNTIKNPLSISEENSSQNELTIYPIPSTGLITIMTNSTENSAYTIVDMNGNILMTGNVSNGDQISIENISNGIYFFRLENGEVEKLIVNK